MIDSHREGVWDKFSELHGFTNGAFLGEPVGEHDRDGFCAAWTGAAHFAVLCDSLQKSRMNCRGTGREWQELQNVEEPTFGLMVCERPDRLHLVFRRELDDGDSSVLRTYT